MLPTIQYRKLSFEEIHLSLFQYFNRRQDVTKCWRKEHSRWVVRDAPFVDDWGEAEYQTLTDCLRNTVSTGGFVYGAFCDGSLKGFVSVEAELFGKEQYYLDLTSIHVSKELRGQGIGKVLFARAGEWAKQHGAKKLYISAHPAVETQAFYRSLGCVEAQVYHPAHVAAEPFDCQLECVL